MTTYSFRFENKTDNKQLAMNGDWLDSAFLELIRIALEENSIDRNYYYCITDDQDGGYIFLTKRQYDYLKEHQPELFPTIK